MNKIEQKLRDNLVVSLSDAGKILGLGRNAAYGAAQRGEIETLNFGRLKKVPTTWLRKKLGLDAPAA
jgi:hypothetical protein